jgi:HAD superfamily hydrolase (TIGR01509 family)
MKTILVDAGKTFVVNGSIYEDMYDLLESYPNTKILLTNANDEQIEDSGLVNLPYDLFTLKHNPDKNDPKYFKILFEKYNLKPKDCIYFDHKQDAVDSAKSLGITSYFYDSEKKDLDELKEFLANNLSTSNSN